MVEYFFFFFNTRDLPVYSVLFGVSNKSICLASSLFQILIAIYFAYYYHRLIPLLLMIISILVFDLCLCNRRSSYGEFVYYFSLTSFLGITVIWLNFLVLGLDHIVLDIKFLRYQKVIFDVLFYYIFTGVLLVFGIMFSFIILSYVNEIKFEEIKSREESRVICEDLFPQEDMESLNTSKESYITSNYKCRDELIKINKYKTENASMKAISNGIEFIEEK